MADILRDLRLALVAIVNADATLRTLMGRTTRLLVRWQDLQLDGPLPVIAYSLIGFEQTGADDDTREGTVQFSVVAAETNDATGALGKAEAIVERLEALSWSVLLLAQGVDGAPVRLTRRPDQEAGDGDSGPREGTRGLAREDLDIAFAISKATVTL